MPLEIEVLEPFGARLHGIALGDAMDDASFAALHAALLAHGVLVVPDAPLSMPEQVALGRRFGEPEHYDVPLAFANPNVIVLSNVGADGGTLSRDAESVKGLEINERWHTDGSFREVPSSVSILSAQRLPEVGGDTFYASLRRAWLAMGEGERDPLRGLRAVHDYAEAYRNTGGEIPGMEVREMSRVLHPLVRVHPETGERCFYVSSHTSGVEGMDEAAGRALLDRLLAWCTREREVYRHRWQAGDVLLWDNRCVLHRAQGFDERYPRVMHHVRMVGDGPVEPG